MAAQGAYLNMHDRMLHLWKKGVETANYVVNSLSLSSFTFYLICTWNFPFHDGNLHFDLTLNCASFQVCCFNEAFHIHWKGLLSKNAAKTSPIQTNCCLSLFIMSVCLVIFPFPVHHNGVVTALLPPHGDVLLRRRYEVGKVITWWVLL